ncbi:MAG TPA: O-antigen ligase family protein [Candidatus Limnocylindrales bacterium]|nr:O-antigen ligase family protein [Candidatus Limnocylindrales bacterium]
MNAVFGATILLVALVITPGWLFYFDVTPKLVILLAGTAGACVWAAVRGWGGAGRAYRLFGWLLAASAAWLAISTWLSRNPALSAFGTNWRRFGAVPQVALMAFAWLLAGYTSGRVDRARAVLRYFVPAAGIAGLYGIAQYFGWDPLLPASAYHVGEGVWTIVRPPGTLGYVSYFATFLAGSAFLCVWVARAEAGLWRAAAYVCAAVAAAAMLLTGTRAAMFALALGGALWLWARGARVPRRVLLVGAAVAAAGAGFYFLPAGQQMRSRARWFAEDPWGGSRLLLWRDGLRMAASRPLSGYGAEVFTAEFPQFESTELARKYPDFVHESPHNMFLDALIAEGVLGLILLVGVVGLGLWSSRRDAELLGALVAVVVAQQFTVFVLPTALLMMVITAVGVGQNSDAAERRRSPGAMRLAFATAAVFFAYCLVRYGVADRELAQSSASLARADAGAAARFYSEYDRWRMPGTSAALWYSRAQLTLASTGANPLTKIQALAQAGAAADRATRESEDPCNAWYNAAAIYATQNDFAHTEWALRSAIHANPHWFKPHWTLAQVLALAGRAGEAEREAALAVDLDGGKHAEVVATLRSLRGQAALHR